MKKLARTPYYKRQLSKIICGSFIFFLSSLLLSAQTNASTIRDLSFGTFYTGNTGGTVIISTDGTRTATGSVVLFSSDEGDEAILTVELVGGETYTITASNITELTNGSGGSMTLVIDDIYPASPYEAQGSSGSDGNYLFRVGGTLTVGSPTSTPAGNYSGTFDITFNEQ